MRPDLVLVPSDDEPRGVHRSRCAVWTSDEEPCDCGAWRALAACATLSPHQADVLFYGDNPAQIADAKAMCDGCPVRRDCSTYAEIMEPLSASHLFGVWAGETPNARAERRRAERRQDRA